jgi:ribosomal protein S12 methylthiotransferase accessory factor
MAGILAPRATTLGAVLSRETIKRGVPPSSRQDWPWNLLKRRHEFGITRVAAITRLDRIGLPVVQVTRPLSLSNVVSQGKGLTPGEAITSALMESLETWAAERVQGAVFSLGPPDRSAIR